jgi:SpoVK/Ycf46/Vps4 family AAA+-type ATPase
MDIEQTLRSLRAALETSPDNVPLRRHLAEVLHGIGRSHDAEVELREALRHAPEDAEVKLLLARVYRAQGKNGAAHVILDDMIAGEVAGARARVERARTLLADGDAERAVREYRKAIDEDPEVADPELAERLGVADDSPSPWAEVVEGRKREAASDKPRTDYLPQTPTIDFASVGGMEDLKQEIRRKIIQPLLHPELYKAYGKKTGGGILLYGPPGCGKTHIARATAGEIKARFLAVGIHEVLDMWIGRSERNLHDVFEIARASKPCVLFFDEADALGASRSDMRTSAGRQTINQFLAELDGIKSSNDGILVLAATNAPWQMDPAFRRPGRFDRVVFVPPPDAEARASILRILLREKPQEDLDLTAIAKRTADFSGADLAAVVDVAVEEKLDAALKLGAPAPITTKDLLAAVKRRKPTTREWFRTVRNYVLYANDDGLYDEIKPWLDL